MLTEPVLAEMYMGRRADDDVVEADPGILMTKAALVGAFEGAGEGDPCAGTTEPPPPHAHSVAQTANAAPAFIRRTIIGEPPP